MSTERREKWWINTAKVFSSTSPTLSCPKELHSAVAVLKAVVAYTGMGGSWRALAKLWPWDRNPLDSKYQLMFVIASAFWGGTTVAEARLPQWMDKGRQWVLERKAHWSLPCRMPGGSVLFGFQPWGANPPALPPCKALKAKARQQEKPLTAVNEQRD